MSVFSRPSNGNGESKNGGEDSGAWKLASPATAEGDAATPPSTNTR